MQVIERPSAILEYSLEHRKNSKKIGLVPTMGALHEGHQSLVKTARAANDIVVVSIFVNPLQFNNKNDLEKYPRPLDHDLEVLESLGVNAVYLPGEKDMYPEEPQVTVNFGYMAEVMEGKFRPGHFNGVGVVVTKLFHHICPHSTYFGLKDLQQYLLIKRMVMDLSFPIEVLGLPIIRETSGLAMSSRNGRLSESGLKVASNIYQGLQKGKVKWETGATPKETIQAVLDLYKEIEHINVEYVELVDPDTLKNITVNNGQAVALCVAVFVEGIRLIDNLYLWQD